MKKIAVRVGCSNCGEYTEVILPNPSQFENCYLVYCSNCEKNQNPEVIILSIHTNKCIESRKLGDKIYDCFRLDLTQKEVFQIELCCKLINKI